MIFSSQLRGAWPMAQDAAPPDTHSDEDDVDGCGLEFHDDDATRDEELPAAAGGVEAADQEHTAGARTGNMPSLGIITNGRPGLSGPLAQLGLGRDGTFFVVAAGRANHAGAGEWQGEKNGNGNFIGIEAENTGLANDQPWPDV